MTITTSKKLKELLLSNRNSIATINGIGIGEVYPILQVTNKHASYYDVSAQEYKLLIAPYTITISYK